ncbi:MAG: pentapeptide repeat-containing protein [Cyanobacteria bacterium J06632_19]
MNAKELIERYQAGERNFYGVDLSGIDFDELNPSLDNFIYLSGANFTEANLSHANFSYISFSHTNFSNANLK